MVTRIRMRMRRTMTVNMAKGRMSTTSTTMTPTTTRTTSTHPLVTCKFSLTTFSKTRDRNKSNKKGGLMTMMTTATVP